MLSNNLSAKDAACKQHTNRVPDKRANVLQKVEVRVVTNTVCDEWYASQGKSISVDTKQMCAGWEQGEKDSCWVSEKEAFAANVHLAVRAKRPREHSHFSIPASLLARRRLSIARSWNSWFVGRARREFQ